jgi:pilus assembly protein CpaF
MRATRFDGALGRPVPLRRRSAATGDLGPEVEPPPLSAVDRLLGQVAADEAVTEIMVNGPGPVWVERRGRVEATDVELDATALALVIEDIVGPLGLRVDRSSPIVDARLADGSRVNVVVPPLAIDGPALSIRRFARTVLPLTAFGPPPLARLLAGLVTDRASILVVGPTSSGKTSLVAALADRADPADRIVCIEETAELPIDRDNLVRLEARPANTEGVGEVTVRRLVLTALRMRPDRLIVGEVRGAEAFDLLLALTSGHRGCLTTCHAADAAAALRRLETLASLAGHRLGADRLAGLVADGLDAVVVTDRRGASRRVIEVVMADAGRLRRVWPSLAGRRSPLAEAA